jgi:signal transduction histidine kinase
MPPHGHFARERWTRGWNDPWVEQAMVRREVAREGNRRARLWLPVVLSLVIQLPGVFVRVHPGVGVQNVVRSTPIPVTIADLALTLLGPAALIFARRFPGPVVAICAAAGATDLIAFNDDLRAPYVALAFALVGAIVRGARVWAWISIAVAWGITLTVSLLMGIDLQPGRIAGITLGILILMGIGEAVRSRRENDVEFSRRYAERKQSEVQAERVRIARELHDVLAHSLSQINVQAGVGLHLMESQPDKARDALASIKDTSKAALDEVRSVLGILRAEGGADPSAPLVPEPDLSRLAGLAASIEAQGIAVRVENSITGPPPAATQLALYRIAQESLTNVLRHAKATAVTVRADRSGDDYELTITDNGNGGGPSRSDGRGLLGMHERAELLGGSLEAGPVPGGGFRVSARIPSKAAE